MKILLGIFFLIISLYARENPFFPTEGEKDISLTTNIQTDILPLKRATLAFPSTARIIKSLTVKYENLDGSISEKTVALNNSIDWHLPLFVSQNYSLDNPNPKKQKTTDKFIKIAKLSFVALYEKKKHLKIVTKDKMIRNFLLTKPHRIVCDFSRDINIRSYEKKVGGASVITKVKFGNHDGYYRIVIELDGYYNYATQMKDGAYLFNFY